MANGFILRLRRSRIHTNGEFVMHQHNLNVAGERDYDE